MHMITPRPCLSLILLCCLTACQPTSPVKPEPATVSDTGSQEGMEPHTLTADARELDKIVCRTEAPVGSRIGTRVCMSRRRWIELEKQSRKMLEDANRSAVVSPIPRASGSGGQ